ncbi:H-type small acid-soluble spore protein [Halalkalibacter sp. APA_J-10(15)]|uniref:H-type small acid-soluble spore protein n=1 Tax=unclassified Halalkalibacter TaxID=2893063 RepID=UPI001FF67AB6|nr:H-type small acid-soluble spore protein [Halalkalibacter sp. APA_J-10(15)]MCK0473172.1 H-type small acid-soluble spore protein [Halalkalibacter sp. APA_J-10(15)]
MEMKRIKQILSSTADVDVTYNGTSVWIDDFNESDHTAVVHLRGPLEERTIVPINELSEE